MNLGKMLIYETEYSLHEYFIGVNTCMGAGVNNIYLDEFASRVDTYRAYHPF